MKMAEETKVRSKYKLEKVSSVSIILKQNKARGALIHSTIAAI